MSGETRLFNLADRHGWPTCARCNKPVDNVHLYDDIQTRKTKIAAECHGEFEMITIDARQMALYENLTPEQFRLDGLAFKPTLPATPREESDEKAPPTY